MAMLENKGMLAGIIMAFIGVIIGLALLSSSADTMSPLTDTYSATNDSFTGVNDTAVEVIDADSYSVVSFSEVRDSTGSTLTEGTGYNVSDNSIIVYEGGGTYYADYTYRSVDYIEDSGSRSLSSLIVLFFALAVFLAPLGYLAWKEMGLN